MNLRLSFLNPCGCLTTILAMMWVISISTPAVSQDAVESSATIVADEDPPQDEKNTKPQRVIVHVNRNLTIAGFVEELDDEVVIVRDRQGKVHRFSRTRVLTVTRLVDPEPGQTGVVFLANGQARDGIILEDHFEYVLMEIEGVRARISRPNVDHVVLEPTFAERYAKFKESLLPGQTRRHLALCQWLVDNKKWNLAKAELDELLVREDNFDARTLLVVVDAQLKLQAGGFKSTNKENADEDSNDSKNTTGPVTAADLMPKQLVTSDDVNIMRIYEIDFNDPPRMSISPDTIRTLIERYGTSNLMPASQTERTALFRAEEIELAKLMFRLQARELYPQINVLSEPPALNEFRLRVHDAWLINNCTTSRCHGGLDAGRLFLHRRNYKDERVRYTNLLILERLELDPEWPLINYDEPLMSLIIQHALPKHAARKPHPDVPGWTPVFTRGNRRTLETSLQWIQSMYQPRPDYPVDYDPPKINQPAPQPKLDEQPEDQDRNPR